MKKLFTLMLVCALALPVFGCGGSDSSTSGSSETLDDARSKRYDMNEASDPAEEGTEEAGQGQ